MFDVFISYAHEDAGLATALASGLGRIGKPWWRRRSLRVFRDASVMTASSDLWDSIRGPLEESRWFVAVISPASAASPWVAREIAWWVENRGSDQLLVVLADGTCLWDAAAGDWAADATAVPAALRGAFDGEPRWVDATWTAGVSQLQRRDGRLIELLAEIAAPVQGTTKDAIVGEELRQHRRTVRTSVTAASLLFVLTIAAVIGALIALDQRDKAESRREQALSQSLAGQATELRRRRPDLGIALAVEAWRHAHTSQAEQALVTAAEFTLPAAERFRAPDNGEWVLELVAVPEHGYVLAGRYDGGLTLWKLPSNGHSTKAPKSPVSPHQASIAALVRDASGRRVVSIDSGGGVAVWDAATLARPATFTIPLGGPAGKVDADLTNDGSTLMVSTQEGVQLWDLDRQVQLGSSPLAFSNAAFSDAAMSPDGTHVGATLQGADGTDTIEIWNLTEGTTNRYPFSAPDFVLDVSFTNDGLYFGMLDNGGGSAAFRVSDGAEVSELTPSGGIPTLTGGPLGGMVPFEDHSFISANGSATALVWNAATSQVIATRPLVLGGSPSAIAISRDGFVASDVAGTMTWVPFVPSSSAPLAAPVGKVPAGSRFGISAAPNMLLATAGSELTVWDTQRERVVRSFAATRADQAVPIFTALDATARRVALGYEDGTLELRNADTGKVIVEKPHLVTGIAQVSFAGDSVVVSTSATVDPGELLVVSSHGSVRRLWRSSQHRSIGAFATSGESVAVGLDDGRLLVWDTARSERHRELNLGAVVAWRIAFSQSGQRLVVGDGGGRLHVVDRTPTQLRQRRDPIATDNGPVVQIGFSSADRVLAVSPVLVSYADIATGNVLAASLLTQGLPLVTVTDGFMTVDPTGALLRWRLDPAFLLSKLCPELKTEGSSPELRSYLDGGAASTTCPAGS